MCPSSREAENEFWTDEAIFMSLFNFKRGKPLPSNVSTDINPYQYRPSDLAVDMWYLCSGVKKDAECGSWVQTVDACDIFSNSTLFGMRTTFQFYEGRAPNGQKTEWVMQEYRITERCDNDAKDHRALCRVFLADEYKPHSTHCIVDTENSIDTDCILSGDYIELNDLIDSGSRSSSSADSSCLTMTSDDYFDSMDLLQELDKHISDQEIIDSRVKVILSAPIKSKEVVICSATSESLTNKKECKRFAEETFDEENRNESTLDCVNISSSSGSSENTSKEGKKESVSRTKRRKMMKYLCLLTF